MSHLIARPASSATPSVLTLRAGLVPLALLGLLSACAGSAPPPSSPSHGPAYGSPGPSGGYAATESYGEAAPSAESDGGGYGGGDYAAGAPSQAPSRTSADAPSARGGVYESEAAPTPYRQEQPRERPGLGTVFGETRVSAVRTSPFLRATSQPFAAMVLHYNDLEGVQAHAQYRGQDWLSPYYLHTPGRGISVSLVDEYGRILQGGTTADRNFVIGQEGQRYEIIVHNQTGGRFELLASVDGLDVIDGLPRTSRSAATCSSPTAPCASRAGAAATTRWPRSASAACPTPTPRAPRATATSA
jgi:hypothetical protein